MVGLVEESESVFGCEMTATVGGKERYLWRRLGKLRHGVGITKNPESFSKCQLVWMVKLWQVTYQAVYLYVYVCRSTSVLVPRSWVDFKPVNLCWVY